MTAIVDSWTRDHPAPARRSAPPVGGIVRPVTTRILCSDPVLAGGAEAYLRGRREITVDAGAGAADVLLVFATAVDEPLRDRIEVTLAEHSGRGTAPRLVLVVDRMAERHLWWAVGNGLRAVLPRSTTSWDEVVGAVVKGRDGGAHLPSETVGWLLDRVRSLDDRLAAVGVNAAGMTARETDILRLFAAGMETADVARELNFSERTIKSALHDVKERLGLRNRAHAVAHALRIGAI